MAYLTSAQEVFGTWEASCAAGRPVRGNGRHFVWPWEPHPWHLASGIPHPIEDPTAGIDMPSFRMTVAELDHGVPTLGYRIDEPDGRRMLPEELAKHGVQGPEIGRLAREGSIEVEGRTVRLEDVSVAKPGL